MANVNYFLKFSSMMNMPIYVCGAGIAHEQERLQLGAHRAVIYTIVSGCGILTVDGQRHMLTPGMLAYLPENLPYEVCAATESFLDNWVSFETNCAGAFRFFNLSGELILLKPRALAAINAQMELIYREIIKENKEGCVNSSVLFYQLLAMIDAEADEVKSDAPHRPAGLAQSRVASMAAEYIEKNFDRAMTLDALCEACGGISGQYLCRQFRRQYNMRPFEYQTRWRLRYAKFLLAQTDEPITEIAAKSGFENPSYFYKKWKQFESIPPLEWRREHRHAFS
ncbi:MAG: helix-turn-helix domain-containing protein [Clostridia bacterium]|nr:helix-turn-helix domain-containing protein [Clostridia bacterium]